ncbi:MAG: hypothetical protein M3494_09935 [Actinomycetota bacterium]|nr:hypothetical protein [Rubrobacter sp.]MDQ3508319.1 hypothetical protein [Actinomycetota bacterium]
MSHAVTMSAPRTRPLAYGSATATAMSGLTASVGMRCGITGAIASVAVKNVAQIMTTA